MSNVYDFAKYFIKNGADSTPNTYDGNMKIQKLLVLSNLISITEYGRPLFHEPILAFENGCVVENVRLRYKHDYFGFKHDSDIFQPDFSEDEYTVLNLASCIFGGATARELSEINHTFNFWKNAYEHGTDTNGYHDKKRSVVDMMTQTEDIERMREIINAYRDVNSDVTAKEIINGITFYYDGFTLTDQMIDQLVTFSLLADEKVYSVYVDNGKLVVY